MNYTVRFYPFEDYPEGAATTLVSDAGDVDLANGIAGHLLAEGIAP